MLSVTPSPPTCSKEADLRSVQSFGAPTTGDNPIYKPSPANTCKDL